MRVCVSARLASELSILASAKKSFWLSCGSVWSGVSAVVGGDGWLDAFHGFARRLVEGVEGEGLDYAFTVRWLLVFMVCR
jgi:hypothetical protein